MVRGHRREDVDRHHRGRLAADGWTRETLDEYAARVRCRVHGEVGAHVDPETGRWVSGTFATAAQRLPAIRDMGFDIVYLPPIHPVGRTPARAATTRSTPAPTTPASPGRSARRRAATTRSTPTSARSTDFDDFVAQARSLGLEVALDLALQCSPDHPWVREHPEWFTTRADGSIAYAENPPKKYQDIYPLNFDNDPDRPLPRGAAHRDRSGSPTGSRCSGSTTRTPSRSSSGSG